MTLEIIQEAIAYLERLQAESTQGEWKIEPYDGADEEAACREIFNSEDKTVLGQLGCACCDYGLEGKPENVELIVVLHRTIEPILELLRNAVLQIAENPKYYEFNHFEYEYEIAQAILGETE